MKKLLTLLTGGAAIYSGGREVSQYKHGLICKDGDKWMYKVWDQNGDEVIGVEETREAAFTAMKKLRESESVAGESLRGLRIKKLTFREGR